jgi:hypothetical protein
MDWIVGLIVVLAFLCGCVFGYDIGHTHGCEKFLKDFDDVIKELECDTSSDTRGKNK